MRIFIVLTSCQLLLELMMFATLDNVVLMHIFLIVDKVKNFIYLLSMQLSFFLGTVHWCLLFNFILSGNSFSNCFIEVFLFILHNETLSFFYCTSLLPIWNIHFSYCDSWWTEILNLSPIYEFFPHRALSRHFLTLYNDFVYTFFSGSWSFAFWIWMFKVIECSHFIHLE